MFDLTYSAKVTIPGQDQAIEVPLTNKDRDLVTFSWSGKVLKSNPTTIKALRQRGVSTTITNDINCIIEVEEIAQEDASSESDRDRFKSESEVDLLDIANADESEI